MTTTTITKPSKILITGDPGAGKTTTAKVLQEILNYPVFHVDTYRFSSATTFHPYNEFKQNILDIVNGNNNYILEGVDWGDDLEFFNTLAKSADIIINFDASARLSINGFFNRFYEHKEKGISYFGINASSSYAESVSFFKHWLDWFNGYLETKQKRIEVLNCSVDKIITVHNYDEADKIIVDLTGELYTKTKNRTEFLFDPVLS